jgi:O-antigen/teichoic acid export membrane protein
MYRRILVLLTGAMGGQALAFLFLPVITRLYSPDQLGAFQIMVAFCNTFGVVAALSFERSLLLKLGANLQSALRSFCLAVVAAMALLSGIFYLIFAQYVPAAPVFVAGVPVVVFVLLMTFFRGLFLVEYTLAIAQGRERAASVAVFTKDGLRIAARILLGLTWLNPLGLFVAAVIDWASGALVLGRGKRDIRVSWGRSRALWRRFRDYPIFYAPAAGLTTLSAQTPLILLGIFYPLNQAGLYSIAFLLLDRPSRIFAKAAGDVLMHRMSRSTEAQGREAVIRKALFMSGFNLLALLGIAAVTYGLAGGILGTAWQATGVLAFACIPHALALFLSDLSIGLFAAVAQTASGLLRQVLALCVLLSSFAVAHLAGWSVFATVFVVGAAHFAVQICFILILARRFRQEREPQ